MKISETQIKALYYLYENDFVYTQWGGQILTSLPEDIKSKATLNALYTKKLVKYTYMGISKTSASITDAGRYIVDSHRNAT